MDQPFPKVCTQWVAALCVWSACASSQAVSQPASSSALAELQITQRWQTHRKPGVSITLPNYMQRLDGFLDAVAGEGGPLQGISATSLECMENGEPLEQTLTVDLIGPPESNASLEAIIRDRPCTIDNTLIELPSNSVETVQLADGTKAALKTILYTTSGAPAGRVSGICQTLAAPDGEGNLWQAELAVSARPEQAVAEPWSQADTPNFPDRHKRLLSSLRAHLLSICFNQAQCSTAAVAKFYRAQSQAIDAQRKRDALDTRDKLICKAGRRHRSLTPR